jgi:hypothetical protein
MVDKYGQNINPNHVHIINEDYISVNADYILVIANVYIIIHDSKLLSLIDMIASVVAYNLIIATTLKNVANEFLTMTLIVISDNIMVFSGISRSKTSDTGANKKKKHYHI